MALNVVTALGTTAMEFITRHAAAIAVPATLILALAVMTTIIPLLRRSQGKQPPSLSDTIPFVSNTYQYILNLEAFLARAVSAWGLGGSTFSAGVQNIQLMLGQSNDIVSEPFMIMVFQNMWNFTPEDLAKFATDKSGRLQHPRVESETVPDRQRYWHGVHHIYSEYMTKARYSSRMADKYADFFSTQLAAHSTLDEWTSVSLFGFVKQSMAHSAVAALLGPHVLGLNPGYVDKFWAFDDIVMYIPFHAATGRYLDAALAHFDWDGPEAASDWEEHFGSAQGFMSLIVFALNANTIPITTWALYELVKDPALFQEVRAEVLQAYIVDATTGERKIDVQKLTALPLLQSIYTETLRVHMSLNLTREVNNTVVVEGYSLKKGAVLQAITQLAHLDEATWGREGHPASEFWAHRHLKHVPRLEKGEGGSVLELFMAGKSGSFVPFGGGPSICPGRVFAKQEILLTLVIVVARFDVEFVAWTKLDGSPLDRSARDDATYIGSAAVPPDRDMKLRWKRLW
ncbi:cytochrome P450 [Podospora appendiculata]|uniref:Cytochrome P450 n=1 Tax=Podospora appendiculata TaxID=314037 RepID=A0AAE0X8M0_9PEZI|nr:cytochrome P450 [Podospora appendiculata]